MPPRFGNVQTAGTGANNWYTSQPPITRTYATACFLATLGSYIGILSPKLLALYWPWVLLNYQLWRPLTTFTYIGPFSFSFVIQMIWLITYGGQLEQSTFLFAPEDYIFLYLFGGGVLLLLSAVIPTLLVFNASPLILMLIYVWSRHFPDQQVSIMGLFNIQSFYLPFAFAGITVVMGGSPVLDIIAILVGHLYWFLKEVYPRTSGRRVLDTPAFLKRLVANAGLGAAQPVQPEAEPPGFRTFRGAGRRLGTE